MRPAYLLFLSVFVFVYETAAAGAAFFAAANADSVFLANVSVFVVTAIAYVTIDFLVKFVVHIILLAVALFFNAAKDIMLFKRRYYAELFFRQVRRL